MPPQEPSYRVLARDLRARIQRGDFAEGQQLPTEARLAEDYDVSRQTVRRAFHDLVADHMVYRVRGRGTFAHAAGTGYVRQVGTIDDLMGLSEDTLLEVISPLRRKVDLVSASRLRLLSDVVYEVRFVRTHDEAPFCVTTVTLPPAVAKLLSEIPELNQLGATSNVTIIGLIDAKHDEPIAEAQQSITVGTVSERDAPSLGCAVGHSVLQVDRLYLDTNSSGVELAVSQFLPEHYSYRVSLMRNA